MGALVTRRTWWSGIDFLHPVAYRSRKVCRKALIGRDHDPYNRASASGECGKGVYARKARRRSPVVRPDRVFAASAGHTVERTVR